MKFRGILVGAVLVAALGGGIYYSNQYAAQKDKESAQDKPKVLAVPEADIARIEIRKRGDDPVVVKRNASNGWDLTAPVQLRADTEIANQIAQAIGSLTQESIIDEKIADWSAFGLKEPALEVHVLKKDGKTHRILIGDDLPAGGSLYLRLNDETKLYAVAGFQRAALSKSWRDLRDRRLLIFEPEKLSRLEMVKGKDTIEFGKIQANEWQILKPKPYRADSFVIDEMARRLRDVRLDPALSEADEKKLVARFNAATPLVTVRTTDPSGVSQLEVRRARDEEKTENVYFAKSNAVAGAHKVPQELGISLEKDIDGFRNKKLFDFGFNDPSKLDLKIGATTRSFGHNGTKWMEGAKEVKPETIQVFIDRLRELSAKTFVADAKQITPDMEVTVTSPDGKKSETVRLAGTLAARGNEPAMYQIDPGLLEELKKQAGSVEQIVSGPSAPPAGGAPAKK